MEREINLLEDLKGKTIENFKLSQGDLYLKFNDGTFAVLVVKDDSEGCYGFTKNKVGICEYETEYSNENLLDLGIITKKEYDDAILKERIAYNIREQERLNNEQERIKKIELEQLEILKAKYNS